MQDEFYVLGAGKLLKIFVIVETIFAFCCLCSGGIWGLVQPFPLTRVVTTVDFTNAEQRRLILADRIAFKLQMREQDAILFQHEEELRRQKEEEKRRLLEQKENERLEKIRQKECVSVLP